MRPEFVSDLRWPVAQGPTKADRVARLTRLSGRLASVRAVRDERGVVVGQAVEFSERLDRLGRLLRAARRASRGGP